MIPIHPKMFKKIKIKLFKQVLKACFFLFINYFLYKIIKYSINDDDNIIISWLKYQYKIKILIYKKQDTLKIPPILKDIKVKLTKLGL